MKRRLLTIFGMILVAVLLNVGLLTAQSSTRKAPAQEPVSTAFTYQGQLKMSTGLVTDTCDFQFSLWEAASGGTQVSSTQVASSIPVVEGLFTVLVDFGDSAFMGEARWLGISVRCPAGTGGYTTLSPRQALTAAPYALALPGLWTQPNPDSPNLIGGFQGNSTSQGVIGASIGGGGRVGYTNQVTGSFGVVAGGMGNTAGGQYTVVGGGVANTVSDDYATIGGGSGNTAGNYFVTIGGGNGLYATGYATTISGGEQNTALGNYGTVGGGNLNHVYGDYGLVAGGNGNTVNDYMGVIGGGTANYVTGTYTTIAGGRWNRVEAMFGTIGGGGWYNPDDRNLVTDESGTISGGGSNQAGNGSDTTTDASYATVGGGWDNTAAAAYSSIGGGDQNNAYGAYASVPGGQQNLAFGDWSLAAGRRAQAVHDGSILFADSVDANFNSAANDEFAVRATGGVRLVLGVNGITPTWTCAVSNGGTWSCSSDRNLKENLVAAEGPALLERLSQMPIYTWNAKGVDPSLRHIGPMAQDFYAAFDLGEDDKHISTIDLDGVALASIQALYQAQQDQAAQITSLQAQNNELEAQNNELEARLTALEEAVGTGDLRPQSSRNVPSQAAFIIMGGLLAGIALVKYQRFGGAR
jgi:hypothetical protein